MSVIREALEFIKNNINLIESEGNKLAQEITEKYTVIRARRWDDAVKNAASNFYGDYSPSKYRRTDALKSIHDIDMAPKAGMLSISFSGTLPGHQNGRLIYDLVFKQGYHGGSYGEDSYESVSSPHYRTPPGKWWFWGNAAERAGISPHEEIMEMLPIIDKEIEEEATRELSNKVVRLILSFL